MRAFALSSLLFALLLSLAPAGEAETNDALVDLPAADLSRAINEIAGNALAVSAAAAKGAPAAPMTDFDRSMALGRVLADLAAAGRARDAAACERAVEALAVVSSVNELPVAAQRRKEMFLQSVRAGRWPAVEATIVAVRAQRLQGHGAKYGADHASLAGAGMWLRMLELSASARCHGGAGPAQGPLLRPAPTQQLRDRLARIQPPLKTEPRVTRLVAQVEALAPRAVPADGATVPAPEACKLKELAGTVP